MKRKRFNTRRLLRLGWPCAVLLVLSFVILRERIGLTLEEFSTGVKESFADRLYLVSDEEFSESVRQETDCLVLSDSNNQQSNVMLPHMEVVLRDMRVAYDGVDLSTAALPDLESYSKIVITTSDLSVLGDGITVLCDWVEKGGGLMNTGTFINDVYSDILAAKAGGLNVGEGKWVKTCGIQIASDFMMNSGGREFWFDEPMESSMELSLDGKCRVHVKEAEMDYPVLWERDYGKGRFVIFNQVLGEKSCRGFLCAAYSLLGDFCVYPVINGSAFYMDDFPSPIPSGEGKYIEEEFGVSINSFYTNIWWPNMLELEEKYGILHTGLIIEMYSDEVELPLERNEITERFTFFGNMLLNHGGELGFHGYNHMPLVLEDYDYKGMYDSYRKWKSQEAMQGAMAELKIFSEKLFPDARFSVYVPPSNILSQEGREAMKSVWEDLKVIASIYYTADVEYSQEFEIAEDGIVETPRITSGTMINDYQTLTAFSELNFHYVQSHFLHPDDVLDEDRGAENGWTVMYESLKEYLEYIYNTAPDIRNLTGSGMGEAVREFAKLSVQAEVKKGILYVNLGGFYEEAYLMIRLNEGTPGEIEGGELTHLTGNLYLLHATEDAIEITLTLPETNGNNAICF